MILTQQDLRDLAQQLPELQFTLAADCEWAKTDLAQAYLNDYGINFAREFAQVAHGFGQVKVAGFRVAAHYWLPENPQGTVLVVHGYYDHTGIFAHPIRFALENNFAVVAFDLPGHGLSSGEPGVINSFDEYGDVLAKILQQSAAILPQPLYAIGQSTGCAVLLNYLWRHVVAKKRLDPFAKIALCSPLVLPRAWRGYHLGRFAYALLRHFTQRIVRNFTQNSHDQTFIDFIRHEDLLQAKYLSLRWIGAMKAWYEMFLNLLPLQRDILVVQGTGDMTVDWRYNLPLIKRKLPNTNIVYVEDAGHQLVNESETYRSAVFAAIKQYFFN